MDACLTSVEYCSNRVNDLSLTIFTNVNAFFQISDKSPIPSHISERNNDKPLVCISMQTFHTRTAK